MKPTTQTNLDSKLGNCLQASIASLFELDLQQVPHFNLFIGSKIDWEVVLSGFVWSMGYDWIATGEASEHKLKIEDMIDGFTEACVHSKNHPGKFHSVIINQDGIVVNDPHPKKAYQWINVFDSGDILSWMVFRKHV